MSIEITQPRGLGGTGERREGAEKRILLKTLNSPLAKPGIQRHADFSWES